MNQTATANQSQQKIQHRIREHESLNYDGSNFFQHLKNFASYKNNQKILSLDGGGKSLKAHQYVGIIADKNGNYLEILPKIGNEIEAKKLLVNMVKTLLDSKAKHHDNTSLSTDKNFPLLEIFTKMFCDECAQIIRKGIRQDYITQSDNLPIFKGKLNINAHIRHNAGLKHRFFMDYDERSMNIRENRLIKGALLYLLPKTKHHQQRITHYLSYLEQVGKYSQKDLDKPNIINRTNRYYEDIIALCRLFLQQQHLNLEYGHNISYALFFDMNQLFESYVAYHLKEKAKIQGFNIKTQDTRQRVFTDGTGILKPDIVINDNIIADTKYKYIKEFNDISEHDLYQMFIYGKKYKAENLYLIYPLDSTTPKPVTKYFDNDLPLHICFFDCINKTFNHETQIPCHLYSLT